MRVAFSTLGCKVNQYESSAMAALFESAGHTVVPFEEPADVYIVNTCTVTLTADKKSRQMIARAHALSPEAPVIVLGCYSETAKEKVASLPGVQAVLGTEGRLDIVKTAEALAAGIVPQFTHTAPFKRKEFEELSAVADSRTRATLKIQDGCDRFCTYCAIPFARGALRSRTPESCLREICSIKERGYKETVLTGIELSLYGRDLKNGTDLASILKAMAECGTERIRLGSLDPTVVDERFADICASLPSLCRQFHLSLQSGSDTVLQRMRRGYTANGFRRAVRLLRERMPEAGITTDVIAGFPGETEQEHCETEAFIKEIGFSRLHVFPYSRRPGTKADAMPGQLSMKEKETRARRLIMIGTTLEEAFIDTQLGSEVQVLAEEDGAGYTGNYIRVRTPAREGEIITMRLTGREGTLALGKEI